MGLSSSNIKKFLTFTYISGNQNPEKKNPYISGNRNPKKLLIFLEIEFFNPSSKNKHIIRPQKIPYILGNFFTLILNPEKMSYIQEKKTLKKFLIFSQMKAIFVF